jgi:4-hydroxybenzoate polyprenyltransferase
VTRPSARRTAVLLVVAGVLLIGAAVAALIGQPTAALVLAIAGIAVLLYLLFRRFGRPGDFQRSGSTGI